MTDFQCITEAIKLQFNREETMNYEETLLFDNGGFTKFNASVTYQIIGAFLENKLINVVIHVKNICCWELVIDFVMDSFKNRVKRKIETKIPEAADAYLKILIVKKENDEPYL